MQAWEFNITVNELLTGEHITMENYKEIAEQNLIAMRKQEEKSNKLLLNVENFLIILIIVVSLAFIFTGCFIAEFHHILGVILCCLGGLVVIAGAFMGLKIEHDAGYYECPECKRRYVPTMKAVVFAPHYGTTRKMKCPYCGNSVATIPA